MGSARTLGARAVGVNKLRRPAVHAGINNRAPSRDYQLRIIVKPMNTDSNKQERLRRAINATLAVVVVGCGAIAMSWLVATKPQATRREQPDRVLRVRATPVVAALVTEPVVGHGTVRPMNQIDIVPEVGGKLIYSHADLAAGKVIPRGALLFEVDSNAYEARMQQEQAQVRALDAAIAMRDQELANLEPRILNAERMLEIEKQNYETTRDLFGGVPPVGTAQQVAADEQRYLRQKDALDELKSRRAMIPHLKAEARARLDAATARLEQANINLANTKIVCPFDARVESVGAHKAEVVTAHFSIAKLSDVGAFEIPVGIEQGQFRWLAKDAMAAARGGEHEAMPPAAVVTATIQGQLFSWTGRISRFEGVDEATRTARIVVEVANVDLTMELGASASRQPLSIGMFCRAELPSEPLHDALVVPRNAIYDNQWVFVFEQAAGGDDGVGRLVRRMVPMLRSMGEAVVVDYRDRDDGAPCELMSGDRVIVSALLTPVDGMTVRLADNRRESSDAITTILNTSAPIPTVPRSSLLVATIDHLPALSGGR